MGLSKGQAGDLSQGQTGFVPQDKPGVVPKPTGPKSLCLCAIGHHRDIPAKSRNIPPKKFDFSGFEGLSELFGPHPFMSTEDPYPTRKYPDSKVWVCDLFSCLTTSQKIPNVLYSVGKHFGQNGIESNIPTPRNVP